MPLKKNTKKKTGVPATPAIYRYSKHIWINKETGCWEWVGAYANGGYGYFLGDDKKLWRAHRWAWQYFVGQIPDGLIVCHKCDNPKCSNPEHLFVGTMKDNSRDMVQKGRQDVKRGVTNCWAKLNDDKVREIRAKFATGNYNHNQLAKEYGVDHKVIGKCINRVTWAHVE